MNLVYSQDGESYEVYFLRYQASDLAALEDFKAHSVRALVSGGWIIGVEGKRDALLAYFRAHGATEVEMAYYESAMKQKGG